MLCLIAAERETGLVIKENLERSGLYPGWQFETCDSAELLAQWAGRPDVVVVSRFLPGRDPVALLRELRAMFPAAHVVLLAGTPSEARRGYIHAAQKLGFRNIVTGRLPGDRPYTLFVALITSKEPEHDGYAFLEGPPAGTGPADAAGEPAPSDSAPGGSAAPMPAETEAEAASRESGAVREDAGMGQMRERLTGVLAMLEAGGEPQRRAVSLEDKRPDRRGILVLTAANKGGVGKTTVAVAVATALARAGVPTVVFDLDFGSPDVAAFLGIRGVPGVEALAGAAITPAAVRGLIARVRGGPDVLPGPMDATLPRFEPEQVVEIVDILRGMYAVIVGDTPPGFWTKPWLADVFAEADYVLAVADQSVQSEHDTRSYAFYLLSMGVTPDRIGIVLNRYSPRLHSPKAVEQMFCSGLKRSAKALPRVVAVIPEDWEAYVKSGYRGTVAGLEDARHSWHRLAEKIAAMAGYRYEAERTGKKRGFPLIFWKARGHTGGLK